MLGGRAISPERNRSSERTAGLILVCPAWDDYLEVEVPWRPCPEKLRLRNAEVVRTRQNAPV